MNRSALKVLSLAAAGLVSAATFAQTSPPAASNDGDEELAQVVVTGSLLATSGAASPTPVTVVSSDQLVLASPRTITESLIQLPVFKGSPSVQNQGTGTTGSNGAAYLNLRGLGVQRTLVLLDGRRVVAASSAGSVDVALLPEALVSSVEVVTGGASAAYGSDAVAGVVNFRLDTKFTGFKSTLQYGVTDYGDNQNYKVSVAGGAGFLDDRLHAVGSLEYYDNKGIETADRRPWAYFGRGSILNPAVTAANPASPTNPRMIVVVNPYSSIAAPGTLFNGTALTNSGLVAGTTFAPGGAPVQFQYGTLRTASTMAGGAGYNPSLQLVLQPAQTRAAAFGHVGFDVTDRFNLFLETNFARNVVDYNSLPTFELGNTAFTIFRDNAFLPAATAAIMNNPAALIPAVNAGRVSADIAIPRLNGVSETQRYVAGFKGDFTDNWDYRAYYQHGENHSVFKTEDDPISDNLYRAVDAVFNGAGQIVCRSTLTNPSNGCVPLNIFGQGSPSAASRAYIVGTAIQDVTVKQDVVEATVTGSLGELPGGPIGLAFGAGYRKEVFDQTTDAISQRLRTGAGIQGYPTGLVNTLGGFERTNPQPSKGDYDVKEGFAEANLPLLTEKPFAEALTFNAAVRYTNYSTSGGVTTWKAGVVYEPVKGYRLRATRSRDIRAPTLGELYQGSSQGTALLTDPSRLPNTPGANPNVLTGNIGNTELTPEEADTTVIGVVLEPGFLPGFTLSVDRYDIDIADAIATLGAQQIVNLCFGGATDLCQFIQRDASGVLSRVRIPFLNVAQRTTTGMDIEASYRMPLENTLGMGAGSLTLRALANHLSEFNTQVQGAAVLKLAGDIGVNNTPKWSGIVSARLQAGNASLYVQERYIGSGKFDNTLTPTDISENHVPSILYTDVTLGYDLGARLGGSRDLNLFFSVTNLGDRDPPAIPGILISGSSLGNRTLYDAAGRSFAAGVRMKF